MIKMNLARYLLDTTNNEERNVSKTLAAEIANIAS